MARWEIIIIVFYQIYLYILYFFLESNYVFSLYQLIRLIILCIKISKIIENWMFQDIFYFM